MKCSSMCVPLVLILAACGGDDDALDPLDAARVVDAIDGRDRLWSVPSPIVLAGEDDWNRLERREPTLSADQRELYFVNRLDEDLHRSTRAAVTDAWSAPQRITELVIGRYHVAPRLSADGNRLYFSSDGPAQEDQTSVWMSTRSAATEPWGPPALVPELNSPGQDLRATPCLGATRFVFESDRGGSFRLHELANGVARELTEIHAVVGASFNPYVTEDCLALYFSAREGVTRELRVSRRASVDDPWGMPVSIDDLDTGGIDALHPWMSAAGDHLVWVQGGIGGSPDTMLLEAFR